MQTIFRLQYHIQSPDQFFAKFASFARELKKTHEAIVLKREEEEKAAKRAAEKVKIVIKSISDINIYSSSSESTSHSTNVLYF